MIGCFILLLYAYTISGIGYDAGGGDRATCGRPYRTGRVYQPPCDVGRLGYCTSAGQLYPWRAVKRFVKDNQGLMRRMYGDQRHGHVLRAELTDGDDFEEQWEKREKEKGGYGHWKPTPVRVGRYNGDLDNDLEEELSMDFDDEPRYLRGDTANDDVLNTKFVVSEQEAAIAIKLAELKAAHFRPVNYRTQHTTHRPAGASTKLTKPPASTEKLHPATSANVTKLKPFNGALKKNASDANETSSKEPITMKASKPTTEPFTEESTLLTSSAATTEDSMEQSTTDTTTEWVSKKFSFPATTYLTKGDGFSKITTSKPPSPIAETETMPVSVKVGNPSGAGEDGHWDQTAEFSENSEVYSESSDELKHPDRNQAMLFQDMVEDPPKKGPVDYHNMKGINACPVKEEVVAPFWANNTRGEVLALLNMYPFEQYVHWEKCTFEHRQMYCREGCRCEQQYRLHRLLAYDPSNECRGIFSDWFKFPSCCVCICYDMPPEFRVTSRSPRFQMSFSEEADGE
ncbi:hypothetical protein HUJ04_008025 [Dendroctonus ponderosae]|uniref:Spaetzle domain-containing protein n=1 Tax=Dendroctonus ponderosae TaxID=77166 RepID=A0AAR5QDX2_DENPD|nr:hypothetical protein HUJ04_008025 [Dendroctonus ponderosae]